MLKGLLYIPSALLTSNLKLTLPARPSRTAATTVAQAPVPQASVAPTVTEQWWVFQSKNKDSFIHNHKVARYMEMSMAIETHLPRAPRRAFWDVKVNKLAQTLQVMLNIKSKHDINTYVRWHSTENVRKSSTVPNFITTLYTSTCTHTCAFTFRVTRMHVRTIWLIMQQPLLE